MGARPRLSSYISTIVVLAAGQGTRMKSEVPKVLHAVAGVAMVNHVLRAAEQINAGNVVVVLGHGHKQVEPHLPKGCTVVLQEEQRGTGHMLREFTDAHFSCGSDASVATMQLDDPTGYGRVIRSPGGEVRRIVEQGDAGVDELGVREVNAGAYVFSAPAVMDILEELGNDNSQGEVYLTDVVAKLVEQEEGVHAFRAPDPEEFMGVNTRVDLADAQSAMRDRICRDWM